MRTLSIFAFSLLAVGMGLFFLSCANPVLSSSKNQERTGSIKVTLGSPSGNASKSIVPPVVGTVSSVTVILTSGSTTQTQTVNGPTGTLTFAGLAAGTWNISATAYDAAGTAIGSGSDNNISVSTTSSINILLPINFTGDGSSTGTLNITLSWPASSGVDTLSYAVQTLSGVNVLGDSLNPTPSSGSYSCIINPELPLAVGAYNLFLTFSKSTTAAPAGKFVEAVNIVAGQTSSCWIDGTGKLQSGPMTIDPSLFFNSTATLASISFTGATMDQGYLSTVTKYHFSNQPPKFSFTLTPGAAGQNISYTWGGSAGSWDAASTATLKSASNLPIDTTAGTSSTNDLIITVIAPDGMTKTTYTFMYPYIAGAAALGAIANDLSGPYMLTSDIDATGLGNWTPIGNAATPFNGALDGGGHTVTYASYSGNDNIGLFGAIGTSGTVKKLKVNAVVASCGSNCALLASSNLGIIDSCSATGSIQVAANYLNTAIGGLVAVNNGTIIRSNNSATVNGYNWYVGGVAAENLGDGLIEYCYNTGAVSGSNSSMDIGGLVGWNSIATIEYCFSTGDVSGTNNIGGLIGDLSAGGSVTNCYSTGKVTVSGNGGGLVGDQELSTLQYCYSIGTAAGNGTVGGIIGSSTNGPGLGGALTVSDCYYNGINNPIPASFGGISCTDLRMKLLGNYPNWNFDSDWAFDTTINGGYPYLIYLKLNTAAYD